MLSAAAPGGGYGTAGRTGASLAHAGEGLEAAARAFTGLDKFTGKILEGVAEGAAFRRPDLVGAVRGIGDIVGEVKDVKYLSSSRQLRDVMGFTGQGKNGTFMLFVNKDTKLSAPLLQQLRDANAQLWRYVDGNWVRQALK